MPAAGPERAMLEIRGVTKRFGPIVACDDVSLDVAPGEIRGLLGQNGAGKSTLMRVVGGIIRPERGEVFVDSIPVELGDPVQASTIGVGIVHQHFSLVEAHTVWENVTLGDTGRLERAEAVERVVDLGERYGLAVDPYAVVERLSPGERQRVEILKCLRREPKVIVLDEPTSVLTRLEAERLFTVLTSLVRGSGRAVVLISHRLEEIMSTTDHVTVLREGRVVATHQTRDTTAEHLASEMLGRRVSLVREHAALGVQVDEAAPASTPAAATSSRPVLELEDVVVTGPDGQRILDSLSLSVRAGEILGVAGVEGNGQQALAGVLSNVTPLASGSVRVAGKRRSVGSRRAMRDVALIPADRHESGVVVQMSVAENLVLNQLGLVSQHGVLSRRKMIERAATLVDQFEISTPGADAPVWTLSGGNQQRVVLAREMARRTPVLVVAQPTQGLDVGAMEAMWERLRTAAREGTGILLISSDIDEILELSDRVAVIFRGRIVGVMDRAEVDTERLGLLMGGLSA
jgi:general nucleoside transport system ATP-binding protein